MKVFSLGLAAALMACGAAPVINDAAESATQRTRPKARPQRPEIGPPRFDQGGMAGCFDPNLSGYARAAAERIGGVPCDTPRRTIPSGAASSGATSIIGAWVQETGYCASGDPVLFERGGGYRNSGGDLAGNWSLSGDTLTIVFSEVDPTTGDAVGRRQRGVMRVTRVNANEIRLNETRYRRCPENGGAEPWHVRDRVLIR